MDKQAQQMHECSVDLAQKIVELAMREAEKIIEMANMHASLVQAAGEKKAVDILTVD